MYAIRSYYVSNQITIGRTEEDLICDLEAMIESILTYEERARSYNFV